MIGNFNTITEFKWAWHQKKLYLKKIKWNIKKIAHGRKQTLLTVPKSNYKIVERGKINTHNISEIHATRLEESWARRLFGDHHFEQKITQNALVHWRIFGWNLSKFYPSRNSDIHKLLWPRSKTKRFRANEHSHL